MSILKSLFMKMRIIIIFVGILCDRHEKGNLVGGVRHKGKRGFEGYISFWGQRGGLKQNFLGVERFQGGQRHKQDPPSVLPAFYSYYTVAFPIHPPPYREGGMCFPAWPGFVRVLSGFLSRFSARTRAIVRVVQVFFEDL